MPPHPQQQHYVQHQQPHNPPRIVYNDLCNFPKTSNYGSMKKKRSREQNNWANAAQLHNVDEGIAVESQAEEDTYIPAHRYGCAATANG